MNRVLRPTAMPADGSLAAPDTAAVREVLRAASELRRGAPVLLQLDETRLVALAAETAGVDTLAEIHAVADGPLLLLLARHRAMALFGLEHTMPIAVPAEFGGEFAAYAPDARLLEPALLRSLADPTEPQCGPETLTALLPEAALPFGGGAAIALAKIARLLPAMLVAKAQPGAGAGLLEASSGAVAAYPQALTAGLRIVAEAQVPLDTAPDARVVAFRPLDGGIEHLAIIVGHPERQAAPLVRVHSACLTGDLLGSLRCDCGQQLRAALARMNQDGAGIVLYLAQEGRGIGLVNKLRAYAVQDRGQDTVDANLSLGWAVDERSFMAAAIMLEQLGISRIRLLTNNPSKLAALAQCGITIVGREPHVIPANGVNDAYLNAKANRMGHLRD